MFRNKMRSKRVPSLSPFRGRRSAVIAVVAASTLALLATPHGGAASSLNFAPAAYADEAVSSTGIWSIPRRPGAGQFRVGWFIKQARYGIAGLSGAGDGRSFDRNMDPSDNRVYLELDYERGLLTIIASPSCSTGRGECTDAARIHRGVTVRSGPGSIVSVKVDVANTHLALPGGYPRITGRMTFSATGENGPCVTGLFDRFPSVEIYHDRNGRTTEVWTRSQSRSLGAVGLSPLTVVNMNSCD